MAITSDVLATKMVTRLNCGLVNGKEVFKTKTYSNLKADATIDSIHAIATTICSLQVPTLEEVQRTQTSLIINDGQ
ncbi:DUF1659 domain-containing protein [Acetobacterium malicum]|jgi:hypothetical protein|uniref:DUF1659 domain-containing protein n=1 Tax=Acetobacterium malicum TaxID=52692 RepID=A0ABR6Z2I5_9FIRM|nr:DUF1659 domain-containing protein [Acetobacterium malicum]MBC3901446.1 DUF1659 domain-containing protein [Acetobacterium malicum]